MDKAGGDLRALRDALGCYVTGLVFVTTLGADGQDMGILANSFTSVSLDPPMVLWCLDRHSGSACGFAQATGFTVSVLSAAQPELLSLLRRPAGERFSSVPWLRGAGGRAIAPDTCAVFECDVANIVQAGDHLVIIGKVERFSSNEEPPVGFHRGRYIALPADDDR